MASRTTTRVGFARREQLACGAWRSALVDLWHLELEFGFFPTAEEVHRFLSHAAHHSPRLERVELRLTARCCQSSDGVAAVRQLAAFAQDHPRVKTFADVDYTFALCTDVASFIGYPVIFSAVPGHTDGVTTILGVAYDFGRHPRVNFVRFLHLFGASPHARFLRRDGDNRVARRVLSMLVRMTL